MASLIHHHQAIVRDAAPVTEHNEYPKMMTHPAFQPASIGIEVVSEHGFKHHVLGTPIRFPAVLVKNEDDEAYYAAKGYVSQGKSDPAAFARAVASASAAPNPTGYVPQRYPMWAGGVLVNNEEEEAAALGARRDQLGIKAAEEPAVVSQEAAEAKKTAEQLEIEALKTRNAELMTEKRQEAAQFDALKAQMAEMQANMAKLMGAPQATPPVPAPEPPAADLDTSTMTKGQKSWATRQARAAERAAASRDAA